MHKARHKLIISALLALTNPAAHLAAYPICPLQNADCNGDGLVNAFDIDPFVLLLTGG